VERNCVEVNCGKEQLEEGLASIRRLVREKKDEVWASHWDLKSFKLVNRERSVKRCREGDGEDA
jgi:hypothetical protein